MQCIKNWSGLISILYVMHLSPLILFIDVNECVEGTDDCHVNAYCTDTVGSFQCTCSPGYSGDGVITCSGKTAR